MVLEVQLLESFRDPQRETFAPPTSNCLGNKTLSESTGRLRMAACIITGTKCAPQSVIAL